MVRRIDSVLALIAALVCIAALPTMAQSGRVFYIDFSSGSNVNSGTSPSSPWKSHPYMNHSSGCDGGAGPGYTHQSGDKFVFKGGVTWPAACFQITLSAGGTSSAQDYYGVCLSTDPDSPCVGGTSWPSTGWTRPFWGGSNAYIGSGNHFVYATGANDFTAPSVGYITLDNIEIGNWNVAPQSAANPNVFLGPAIVMGCALNYCLGTGTVVENVYIHDWVADTSATPGSTSFAYGVVYGAALLQNSTISDQSGHYKVNGTTINWPFMGGCAGCGEVKNSVIKYGWMGCSSCYSVHDSEFDHMEEDTSGLTYSNPPSGIGIHSHAVYDDAAGITMHYVYNNYIHDGNAALVINAFYEAAIFNNVISNMTGNGAIYLNQCAPGLGTPPCGDNPSQVGYVANNTIDVSMTGTPCYKWYGAAGLGTLNFSNNICITGGGAGGFSVTTMPGASTNRSMSTSEASTYGFTAANKYSPSSSDPNTVAKGSNLTGSCDSVSRALCADASGARWFGGSYIARTTAWDLGAYGFGGQSSSGPSQPDPPTNLTATVQ